MKYIYPTLELEIYKRGIKLNRIASQLGICTKALNNKLKGLTEFTWSEACTLQIEFFSNISKDDLFVRLDEPKKTA